MPAKKIELDDEKHAVLMDDAVLIREEPDRDGAFWHGITVTYAHLQEILEEAYIPVEDANNTD